MKILISVIFILALSSCSSKQHEYIDYGEPLLASHNVSIYEILGNLEWYDNQPVSLRGVASFDFHRESASGIYATKEDYENWSYGWLVLDLEKLPENLYSSLTILNGEYVTIYGIFHKYNREKLPLLGNDSIITICKGICGAAGYIEVIRVVE